MQAARKRKESLVTTLDTFRDKLRNVGASNQIVPFTLLCDNSVMEKLCLACGACPSRKDTRYLSGVTGAHLLPLFNKLVELSFTHPVDIQRFLQYCSSTTGI